MLAGNKKVKELSTDILVEVGQTADGDDVGGECDDACFDLGCGGGGLGGRPLATGDKQGYYLNVEVLDPFADLLLRNKSIFAVLIKG